MREQVLRANVVAARSAAARVGDRVETWKALAAAEARSPAFDAGASAEASSHLAALLEQPSDLLAVSLADPAGVEAMRAQRPSGGDLAAQVLAAADSSGASGDVLPVRLGDELWLVVAAELPESRGSLRFVFDGAAFGRAVEQDITGEQASLALLDRSGAVLAGAPLTADDLPEALTNAQSGRLSGAGLFTTTGRHRGPGRLRRRHRDRLDGALAPAGGGRRAGRRAHGARRGDGGGGGAATDDRPLGARLLRGGAPGARADAGTARARRRRRPAVERRRNPRSAGVVLPPRTASARPRRAAAGVPRPLPGAGCPRPGSDGDGVRGLGPAPRALGSAQDGASAVGGGHAGTIGARPRRGWCARR